MNDNPFKCKPISLDKTYMNWTELSAKPYDPKTVEPFTKLRIILANGAEFEAVKFSHCASRNCPDNDLRRDLALLRKSEQMQQKLLSSLKPISETILQHTIGYEQLAVELTSILAKNEPDKYVKHALDFALLEDFDHLYRYANLLEMDTKQKAEELVGKLTEIMPARPTIAEHRYPADDVKRYCNFTKASLATKLNVGIITAAEQQTMNYYMNQLGFYPNKVGRDLYAEIALIEEQHVTSYGCLLDTNCTMLENLVMHEYTECYLYYSLYNDEPDKYIKDIYARIYEQEVAHLHYATHLLNKYEQKEFAQVVGKGDYPKLLQFSSNIDYVRKVIEDSATQTGDKEDYIKVSNLDKNSDYAKYQEAINGDAKTTPSHKVICKHIDELGQDYRYETKPHPIEELASRKEDNTTFARI
ncbi:MAG: hypothetical protein RR248_05220 [Clostridia bacterium]